MHNINQWLDTPEQIEYLVEEYLEPFRNQPGSEELEIHGAWLSIEMLD